MARKMRTAVLYLIVDLAMTVVAALPVAMLRKPTQSFLSSRRSAGPTIGAIGTGAARVHNAFWTSVS